MLVKAVPLTLPGGEVKYQCSRCWGVYNTREQAEHIGLPGSWGKRAHRCRARPDRMRLPDTGESGETYDVEMESLKAQAEKERTTR